MRTGGEKNETRLDDLIKIPFHPRSPRLFNEARARARVYKKDEMVAAMDRNVRILDGPTDDPEADRPLRTYLSA